MSSNINIINADKSDAKDVCNIFIRSRANMIYLPLVHTQKEIEIYITNLVNNGEITIIKDGDVIAGFMHLKNGWLNHLYIDPKYQKKGFGKMLLNKAKVLSPNGIELMVFEENIGAINFYEREGFKLIEKRDQKTITNEENLPDRKYKWVKSTST